MGKSVAIIGTRGYPSFYGGFETLVRQLAPYLADQGWDVTVYGRDGSTKKDTPDLDPRVHAIVTKGVESKSLSTLSYGLTSSVHAARHRPDVALVMNVANGYWLPLLRARGIPTVVNVDGIEWERAKWGKKAKAVFRGGARLTAKFGDHLVYDSQEIARRWAAGFKRDGIFIPYGGTDPGPLEPVPELAGHPYALMVARFVPENTVVEFFDAAERLSKRWDIAIVGSSGYGGELDERVKNLAAENERIHWFGHVSDDRRLFSLWQHAGAYFHGHSVGGTNPALVQAMACKSPIVARDTVYNREVLGDTALFVDPEAGCIEATISKLLQDSVLQGELRRSAHQRAAHHYSWNGVCALYDACLRKAID
ncbi:MULTISPECIES: glycosyltransferase [Rhodococcus]|uniref:Glycosyltransferase n=1 Tax=Rhodococcus oxybenzonivorans TaxID=1990687 RepID=A0AAE5A842_9NOCA|nr:MULTISPECIES: glycosyltransferase [Rhodococcus]MDV7243727.1 glycosyltransferase [Rhodococcus oxybenzonivorans]MDV7267201.1 glycosyltransferase [Rhodococcus oxybenzonivorans]MDV7275031.1 glycosyltransferase [Rhodococcus oxybenzonivorans]MDV7335269.1 glycosyltransferase [Rhodococcus oxybenzonivorans]MDV7345980.1 glycosyltransferase [Rhodococcus oxybenzonivorans]